MAAIPGRCGSSFLREWLINPYTELFRLARTRSGCRSTRGPFGRRAGRGKARFHDAPEIGGRETCRMQARQKLIAGGRAKQRLDLDGLGGGKVLRS